MHPAWRSISLSISQADFYLRVFGYYPQEIYLNFTYLPAFQDDPNETLQWTGIKQFDNGNTEATVLIKHKRSFAGDAP